MNLLCDVSGSYINARAWGRGLYLTSACEVELSGLKGVGVKAVSVLLLTLFCMNFSVRGNRVSSALYVYN